jgi:hypothetical protein
VGIPRENLLNAVADVTAEGKYVSPISDPDQVSTDWAKSECDRQICDCSLEVEVGVLKADRSLYWFVARFSFCLILQRFVVDDE